MSIWFAPSRRARPSIEILEGRLALSAVGTVFKIAEGTVGVKQNDHTQYSAVGSSLQIELDAPAGRTFKTVTFKVPGALEFQDDNPGTLYTVPDNPGNTVGFYDRLVNPRNYTYPPTPSTNTQKLAFYWDETVGARDIEADATLDDGSMYTGHISVTVEAPTVNAFSIQNNAPIQFTQVNNNAQKAQPGQGAGFGILQNSVTAQVYTAKATNTTTISGLFGIIQLVDATWSYQHAGSPLQTATTGGYELDPSQPAKNGFYYYRALASTSPGAVQQLPDPNDKVLGPGPGGQPIWIPNMIVDSPTFKRPFQDANGGFLQSLSMTDKFKSMLVYQADGGVPIVLSTAQWMLQGSATNAAVAVAGGNILANETNMANWTVDTLISGPIANDGTLPTTNNGWAILAPVNTLSLLPIWGSTVRRALQNSNGNFFPK